MLLTESRRLFYPTIRSLFRSCRLPRFVAGATNGGLLEAPLGGSGTVRIIFIFLKVVLIAGDTDVAKELQFCMAK